ncbi:hypothetical protein [Oceanirhabdus sp. W0125-5]|uniref:hypothetical protein n=1 Tax=Oceanirhabdus sp. W0125-5 TaxID=2999116 RepID=UPI0022F307EF|nr:hypothetical protein [Oceanirhabdus sp. W0125-5]WBW98151.1 hypothetical protein OW730_05130 [Oceanirhabdus sp. W0125-5]
MPVKALRGISGLYNDGILDDKLISTFTLIANGGAVWTAFHEIAQLNIAKELNKRGYDSILEYEITSKTQKNRWGRAKKYEADIVSGDMVWEVKPIGTDGTAQLNKYMTDGDLMEGFTMKPITDIDVIKDIKMMITFDKPGLANYSFYKYDKFGDRVTVTSTAVKSLYKKRQFAASVVVGGIILGTLAEDVFTGGAGIADDIPSLAGALGSASYILGH